MNFDKYSRNVSLACPTCGCTEFEGSEVPAESTRKCMGCHRTFSDDELIELNVENVNAHAEEVGKEIVDDLAKDFSSTLSRNKLFTKK